MSFPEHFSRRALLACALLAASVLVGCGEDDPGDSPELVQRLLDIPGLTVREVTQGVAIPQGYRFFVMEYEQPADHANPDGVRFRQRMTLLHTSETAPTVLYTGGYFVSLEPGRRELTQMLGANQLSVEHRFFGPSRPEPADWSLLNIRQSAEDFHRIVQAFKPLYPGRWLSTGGSKGGETMVFFRRFFPDDVDATVAYVAPIARPDDERFIPFQEAVGTRECRERLKAFQQALLDRRDAMVARMDGLAAERGLIFETLGKERALEHAAIEFYFYFWQYDSPARCGEIPLQPDDASLWGTLDEVVNLAGFSDQEVEAYGPYYYQAATELGWPRPFETHLASQLRFPGTDVPEVYVPNGVPVSVKPDAMTDIQDWVSTRGERLMFVYGAVDPWSAAPYALGDARDSYLFSVPGGNHGSRIAQLPEPQRSQARALIQQWAGVGQSGLRSAQAWTLEPEGEEFGPRRHLRVPYREAR